MSLETQVQQHSVGDIISDSALTSTSNRDYSNIFNDTEAGTNGPLLFSDSPETVSPSDFNKVLFYSQKIVKGSSFRVYLDHVNGGTAGSSPSVDVNVWIGNLDPTAAIVHAYATGQGNSGHTQIVEYLNDLVPGPPGTTTYNIPVNTRVIVAGTDAPLPPGGDAGSTSNINLVWDFDTNANIEVFVTIGNIDLNHYIGVFAPSAAPIGHVRGVFPGSSIKKGFSPAVPLSTSASKYHTVGIGKTSANVKTTRPGIDYTIPPHRNVTDDGIFGMLYEIDIPVSNSTNQPLCYGIVLNPRAGVLDNVVADIGAGEVIQGAATSRSDQGFIVSKTDTPLAPNQQQSKRFYFMLPGGSSSPVEFVVVPFGGSGSC